MREIAVVFPHEVALVEQADGESRAPIDSSPLPDATPTSARAEPRSAKGSVHPGIDGLADEMQAAARVLNHRRIAGVDHDRRADADRTVAGHRTPEALDRIRLHADIGVHEEHVGLRRLANGEISAGIGTVVRCQRPDLHSGARRAEPVDGAVSARRVHNHDAFRRAARGVERLERRGQGRSVVVADDGDGDVFGEGGRHENQYWRPRPGRRVM